MFGSIFRRLRLQKGMSQDKIAEELHVVRQTISKWENGLSSPSVEQLISLLNLLDVQPELLLGINDKFASEHPAVLELSKHEQPTKGNSPAEMKKGEMITDITNRLEGMNETGVTFIFDLIMLIPLKERWLATASPERIAELDAIAARREQEAAQEKEKAAKEAQQKATAKRDQIYMDYARMFNAIKTVDIPVRYDLSLGEIWAIDFMCGEISRIYPEYAYSVACNYFKYGFVKGKRYAMARAKKKQK